MGITHFGGGLAFEVLWQLWIWSLDAIWLKRAHLTPKRWEHGCFIVTRCLIYTFVFSLGLRYALQILSRGWRLVFEVSPNWSKYNWFNKDVIFWLYHCWKKLDWDLWGWKMALKVLQGDWRLVLEVITIWLNRP